MTKLSLLEAEVMPLSVDVVEIAEQASQAAFKTIADGLAAAGFPVSGDFAPDEIRQIDNAFAGFVLSMALNNETIAGMQNRPGSDAAQAAPKTRPFAFEAPASTEFSSYVVDGLDVYVPESLDDRHGVHVELTTTPGGHQLAEVSGPTFESVVEYVSANWGEDDPEWFQSYVVERIRGRA